MLQGWRQLLRELPEPKRGRWGVAGSAAEALHGLAAEPRDVDLVADEAAAAELLDRLDQFVVTDEVHWVRADLRADRRALVALGGIELEILVGVEVAMGGIVSLGSPDLDHLDHLSSGGRRYPVLPLPVLITILEATGKSDRAARAREELSRRSL